MSLPIKTSLDEEPSPDILPSVDILNTIPVPSALFHFAPLKPAKSLTSKVVYACELVFLNVSAKYLSSLTSHSESLVNETFTLYFLIKATP
jgi:hypothetical protein